MQFYPDQEFTRIANEISWGMQEFEAMPSDTEVNPGSTVSLRCKVRNRRGECVWLKNGFALGKIPGKYELEREPADGDCSVHIYKATIEEDDGDWQCQVTQVSVQDALLSSKVVKLVVREEPHPPRLEESTNPISPGELFKTKADDKKRFQCVSRKGNPPAALRWFLDDQELTLLANQTNQTDVEKARTWQAISVLHYAFGKKDNRRQLKCVSYHGTYESPTGEGYGHKDVSVTLDVMYPPEIKYEGNPREEVEEGAQLTLRCSADANPPANIVWRKSGQNSIYDIDESISFPSISRTDSGVYSCSAKNDFGDSPEVQVNVNVKFRPRILRVEPATSTTVNVDEEMKLYCVAEGNPPPSVSWLQQTGRDPKTWTVRSRSASLVVQNTTYSQQGTYMCEATNTVKDKPYRVVSPEIRIDVRGPPQVLTESGKTREMVIVNKDEDASIRVVFCSDPRPRDSFWEWGAYKLKTGNALNRFIAEPLLSEEDLDNCYESRLIVQRAEGDDSRKFTLHVENDKGKAFYSVALEVREPIAMSLVVGIVVGGVLFLVVFLTLFVYLLRSQKMCFKRGQEFTPDGERPQSLTMLDSDIGSATSHDTAPSEKVKADGGNGAIPPDALYSAPKTNGSSNGTSKGTSTDGPQYENVKNGRPEPLPRTADGSVVYASLDLAPPSGVKNGVRQQPERTEYAELQFQPSGEHAEL
ncbi:kin of IRRE-like protein 1 isoform X2 [Ornithodoros turicata]|uniref:kin of IRRE-like protein 1 isoform X2 n=1 Tax=Ornithodoros turicata TaxID=34597 RepID=UPI0031393D60